jgi:hypothetical protein
MNEMTNVNYTIQTNAPSIASSAMLVELTVSVWTGMKRDKKASEGVEQLNNANKGVASVNKKLLGDCAELTAIQKFVSKVRELHYGTTLPWSDMGPRLLPTAKFFKYQTDFTGFEGDFYRMVDEFLDTYDLEVAQAQAKLGDLFDADEYPTVDDLRRKFNFKINYIPLPSAGDFRLDINNEAAEVLRQQYEKYFTNQLDGAMRDIWKRLYDTLTILSRQLADQTEEGKTPKIYASVFERMLEVIDLMETCNVTGDMQMQLMQRKLAMAFRGVDVASVKDNSALRRDTKHAVDEAMKALPSLDW